MLAGRFIAGVIATLLMGLAALPASASATTIGNSTPPDPNSCQGAYTVGQLGAAGASYTVPAGSWRLISWTTQSSGDSMAAVVLRPTATADEYYVVGVSDQQALTGAPQTFPADILVEGGDFLGFLYLSNTLAACALATGDGSDFIVVDFDAEDPQAGDTIHISDQGGGGRIDIEAELLSLDLQSCNGQTASAISTANGTAYTSPGVTTSTSGGVVTFHGTSGDDVIIGTDSADEIIGAGGDDTVCSRKGDDLVRGNAGSDYLSTGTGMDGAYGAGGADEIHGVSQGDALFGGNGDDVIHGDGGADTIRGDAGDDAIHGDAGSDSLDGDNPSPYHPAGTNDLCDGGNGLDTEVGGRCETTNAIP